MTSREKMLDDALELRAIARRIRHLAFTRGTDPAAPAAQDADAKDAARYRWLKNNNTDIGIYRNDGYSRFFYVLEADEDIDRAMAQEGGA